MAAAIVAAALARRTLTSSRTSSGIISPYSYYEYVVQSLYFSSTKSLEKPPSSTSPLPVLFTEDYFISKYQFSPQIASKLASASAAMKNPQNPDAFLSFLKQTGFSNTNLERIVRHHTQLLSLCPEKSVKPKFKIFQDLGLSSVEVSEIIARNPTILHNQPKRIIHIVSVFKTLLGSTDLVIKLIKKHGNMLYADPEKTILPNIQFLNTCGIQTDQINSLIYTFPGFFLISPENMRRCVHKADEMGVDRTSKMFIYAVRTLSMMPDETLELRLKRLQDLGFSEHDILRVFRSDPGVIGVSKQRINEVIEVLLETGKYDMSCILKSPESLMFSVEKRYKPRIQVLKELERKGLISKWPSLSTLCHNTDKSFFKKFVAPNINEVGEDCSEWKTRKGTAGLKTTLG